MTVNVALFFERRDLLLQRIAAAQVVQRREVIVKMVRRRVLRLRLHQWLTTYNEDDIFRIPPRDVPYNVAGK